MASASNVEWTGHTWNPLAGCSVLTAGCKHCYAMKMAKRLGAMGQDLYKGLTADSKAGAVWTGEMRRAPEHILLEPLRRRTPTTWFVNSMSDLFHENVPNEWIDVIFAVMALSPQHTFQVLTKRAERMRRYLEGARERIIAKMWHVSDRRTDHIPGGWPLLNVWLGVSAERQQEADERIPHLLHAPAMVRFISAEPLLGPIDLVSPLYHGEAGITMRGYLRNHAEADDFHFHAPKLDWVIVGGESGPGARPMHPGWPRSLRDQCAASSTMFFFKQWGAWAPICEMPDGFADTLYHPAPRRDPEAIRRSKVESIILHKDGSRHEAGSRLAHSEGTESMLMFSIGKSRAGRLLNGIEHNGMPGGQV